MGCTIYEMKERNSLMGRLERLQPLLRSRLSDDHLRSEALAAFGSVTVHQMGVLRILVEEGPLTMNQLAERTGTGPSAITQLVDRLTQHDLVERTSDPSDRRVQRIVITTLAADTVKRFKTARRDSFTNLLVPLSDAELQTFVELLEKMLDSGQEPPGEKTRKMGRAIDH